VLAEIDELRKRIETLEYDNTHLRDDNAKLRMDVDKIKRMLDSWRED